MDRKNVSFLRFSTKTKTVGIPISQEKKNTTKLQNKNEKDDKQNTEKKFMEI